MSENGKHFTDLPLPWQISRSMRSPQSPLAHLFRLAASVAALFFIAPSAHAYCRMLTEAPPAGFDATASGCFTKEGLKELYWKSACVGFDVQKDASQYATLDQTQQAVLAAFEIWKNAPCPSGHPSIESAVDLGPVECTEVEYNSRQPNQNVILFRDDAWPYPAGDAALAYTTVHPELIDRRDLRRRYGDQLS